VKKLQFILILCISFCGLAQNNMLFEKANKAYNEGSYDEAAKDYLAILENGEHSAELYFNLGNVYYKQNQIAPSIYYYEKALLLKPNDPEIKNNLAYAQNMTLDAIEVMPETGLSKLYKSATSYFSFEQWAYTSILLMVLFVIGYLLYYFLTYATHKRIAFIISVLCFFLAMLTIVIAYTKYQDFNADQPAIIFDEEVIVKSEPNERSEETFRLHQGTKVLVLEQLNNWQKIRIADGKTGWLPSESMKLLKDF
tara:strand:- start:24512 stop:25270 length:759 start_codon:yes stop_codon:yes gene_type:complete